MLNNPRISRLNRKLLKAIVCQKPRKEARIKRKILRLLAQHDSGDRHD